MFPEFPKVHAGAARAMNAAVRHQIVVASPILGQVHRFHQHEGGDWDLRRADGSEDRSGYQLSEASASVTREALRSGDHEAITRMVVEMAEEMAKQQSQYVFARISEAVEAVGNSVHAGGDFQPEHLLEVLRRKEMSFDPVTLEPTGEFFVVHPDTFKKIEPKLREWEKDPAFRAAHDALMEEKRREWREREASRKLVD